MRDQQQRKVHHVGDGGEILQRVIRQFFVEAGVHGHGPSGGHSQGVAIRRRLHQGLQTHNAIGTGPVVDHHLLTQAFVEFLRHHPRNHIVSTTRWKRYDDADGFAGKSLCHQR